MPPYLTFGLASFGAIFSIVDPFAALPVFLALTGSESEQNRKRIAARAALTCLLVLSTFAIIGPALFQFFGITIPAFRIAGGLLLFGISMEMMHAKVSETKTTEQETEDAAGKEDVGLIPVGIPLLSGPGAIASVMMHSGSTRRTSDHIALLIAIVCVAIASWVLLRFASRIAKILGKTGMNLIARIMGLILAAVAIQFVLDGLQGAFPKLFV